MPPPDVSLGVGSGSRMEQTERVLLAFDGLLAEAGRRSFDRTMPDEDNRRVTDAISTVLFAPSADVIRDIMREGIDPESVHLIGNTMIAPARAPVATLPRTGARAGHCRSQVIVPFPADRTAHI